jgi:uncharacterized protein
LIKVVLDANVLISGLISRTGPPGQILDLWLDGKIQICLSPQTLGELVRVLHYPRIDKRIMKDQLDSLLEMIHINAEMMPGDKEVTVLTRDASDNIYLACAVEAKASYLVTGNIDHFKEAGEKYRGVHILAPRAFCRLLEQDKHVVFQGEYATPVVSVACLC